SLLVMVSIAPSTAHAATATEIKAQIARLEAQRSALLERRTAILRALGTSTSAENQPNQVQPFIDLVQVDKGYASDDEYDRFKQYQNKTLDAKNEKKQGAIGEREDKQKEKIDKKKKRDTDTAQTDKAEKNKENKKAFEDQKQDIKDWINGSKNIIDEQAKTDLSAVEQDKKDAIADRKSKDDWDSLSEQQQKDELKKIKAAAEQEKRKIEAEAQDAKKSVDKDAERKSLENKKETQAQKKKNEQETADKKKAIAQDAADKKKKVSDEAQKKSAQQEQDYQKNKKRINTPESESSKKQTYGFNTADTCNDVAQLYETVDTYNENNKILANEDVNYERVSQDIDNLNKKVESHWHRYATDPEYKKAFDASGRKHPPRHGYTKPDKGSYLERHGIDMTDAKDAADYTGKVARDSSDFIGLSGSAIKSQNLQNVSKGLGNLATVAQTGAAVYTAGDEGHQTYTTLEDNWNNAQQSKTNIEGLRKKQKEVQALVASDTYKGDWHSYAQDHVKGWDSMNAAERARATELVKNRATREHTDYQYTGYKSNILQDTDYAGTGDAFLSANPFTGPAWISGKRMIEAGGEGKQMSDAWENENKSYEGTAYMKDRIDHAEQIPDDRLLDARSNYENEIAERDKGKKTPPHGLTKSDLEDRVGTLNEEMYNSGYPRETIWGDDAQTSEEGPVSPENQPAEYPQPVRAVR
ncbi:MAG: hypothetical protein KKH94_04140, partial [Candidatus Omnitrophica bacterium]|nr:hypothetical protein [Candidatus Omnitrophota bacterium]